MIKFRGRMYRLLARHIFPTRKVLCRTKLSNQNSEYQPNVHTEVKHRARDYYSRMEIATLFLQPLSIVIVYIAIVWNGFKYYCDVRCLDDLIKTLRWKYTSYKSIKGTVDDD
ncbi:putative integral membrane protein [Babesia bovis T2Bo]|uniref:putative integral membrane protein n=1 Tax=Babesia bovis T2Bo TaxID=484906 RepID=UPI001C3628C6|nr:putative integral membrane protein [Babesia bovis T2Bo]KAG6440060.1 putative integral membrane protein [Babesia bovis T2Bo]